MRKLLVTCMCGERIQVPRSALGRTGLCPSCGRAVKITPDNAAPMQSANASAAPAAAVKVPAPETDIDDAKLLFGKAVDHYYAGEVAQALVLFSRLCARYPGHDEIVRARTLCANALQKAVPLPPQPAKQLTGPNATESKDDESALTTERVRKFILHKMLYAETELAQIQAAELAGRMVGLFPNEPAEELKHVGNY